MIFAITSVTVTPWYTAWDRHRYWRWGKFVAIPLPNMTKETSSKGIWDTKQGEHNAHADIAFASASFRKAAEYSKILGVDADLRTKWLSLLDRMPSYPTQTLTWVKNDTAVIVGDQLSGKPLLTEARAAPTPGDSIPYPFLLALSRSGCRYSILISTLNISNNC